MRKSVVLSVCLFVFIKSVRTSKMSVCLSVCLPLNVSEHLRYLYVVCLFAPKCVRTLNMSVLPEGRAKAGVAGQFASIENCGFQAEKLKLAPQKSSPEVEVFFNLTTWDEFFRN